MKISIVAFLILLFISCNKTKSFTDKLDVIKSSSTEQAKDSLFKLEIVLKENFVRIELAPKTDFIFPDDSAKREPYKVADFNADGKEDILVYLGACGTGGCMYGLFLNQYKQYYKLSFFDYLKGPIFKKDKKGFLTITSFEEAEPYNPTKVYVTIYGYHKKTQLYKIDTTYVSTN